MLRTLTLLLPALLVAACSGGDDDTAAGGATFPSGDVTGATTTPVGEVPLVAGVALADTWNDGALTVALTSWTNPGCDPSEWGWAGLDQGGAYAYALTTIDPFFDEATASLSWGDGQQGGGGSLFSEGTLTLDPATAEGLAVEDVVTGTVDFSQDPDTPLTATFSVHYCGEADSTAR